MLPESNVGSGAGAGENAQNREPLKQAELVDALTAQILELIEDGNPTPIVLIDGRAGSGKSTLADLLQRRLFKEGESLPRVVHMDDLYLGWDGLEQGSDYMLRFVLRPTSKRTVAEWREFDWAAEQTGETIERLGAWREFRGGTPLIIEGCGALSEAAAELADIKVWLEVGEETRHERWLKREGSDEFWGRWAAQELEFYAREKSPNHANIIGN